MSNFNEYEKKLIEKYGHEVAELLTMYTFDFLEEEVNYNEAMDKAYNKIIKEMEDKEMK